MRVRLKRCTALLSVATCAMGLVAIATPASAGPVPQPLIVSVSGANAVNRIQDPGRRCADGGSGEYRHASIEAALPTTPTGVISSNLPGVIRGSFDVHHDGSEPVGTPLSGAAAKAFLQGTESHVTMSNQRGSVQLRLTSGTCASPSLAFDGTTVTGTGTWTLDPTSTTGSYRNATGSGTFNLTLGVAPGADNPWSLAINGTITVLQPHLQVDYLGAAWGNLGLDYVTRRPTVLYRISNTGPGDSFEPVMQSADSPTGGVGTWGPEPYKLPDLASGQSTTVAVRYQFGLLAPCALVILNCKFDAKVVVSLPDTLDKADTVSPSVVLHARAPSLPPPL
ncbi:MAG: hypothetical protein ABI232_01430 [Jatrophihabitantaceae bacterium]